MAQYFEIKINEEQLDAMLVKLHSVPKAIPRVLRNAVNDTAVSARAEIGRRVAKAINVKEKTVKARIKIKKATLKNWRSWIRIEDRPMSLLNFKARQTSKGVSYRGTDGSKKFQEHAFIPKKGGNKGFRSNVWVRMKKGGIAIQQGEPLGDAKLVGRKPLQRLVGPSVSEMFHDLQGLSSDIISKAMQNLNKNVLRHINLILGKKIIRNKKAAQ